MRWALLALVFWLALPLGAAASPDDQASTALLRQALAAAPSDFVGLHAATGTVSTDEIDYPPSPAFASDCADCTFIDEFETAEQGERWSVQFDFPLDPTLTQDQARTNIRTVLGRLVTDPDSIQSGSTQFPNDALGILQFDWTGPNGLFIHAETYGGPGQQMGYAVTIGHDVTNAVHIVPFALGVSDADRAALVAGMRHFMTVANVNAGTNFASLRVHPTDGSEQGRDQPAYVYAAEPDTHYDLRVPLSDAIFERCDIDSVLYPQGNSHNSFWDLSCDTVGIGGAKAAAAAAVRDAVAASLPRGFVPTASSKVLGGDDYGWVRGPDLFVISIASSEGDDGTTFSLKYHHNTPNLPNP